MSWSDFVELLRESVITQALITLLALGVTFYLVGTGQPVPEQIWTIDGLIIGFYFGGKVQATATRIAKSMPPN